MRTMFIGLFLVIIGMSTFPERLAVLEELEKPKIMKLSKDQLLISDATPKVHLYNMKGFKYRQVGKKGNGPGEYPVMPRICFTDKHIFIYRRGKCMYFSREGEYKKEFKIQSLRTTSFYPFGKNFLIERAEFNDSRDMHSELSIVTHTNDDDLKYKKLLYCQEPEKKKRKEGKSPTYLLPDYFDYEVYNDRVFVHDNTIGFYVEIYDLEGNQIGKINIPYEKTKVPSNYADKYIELFKKNGAWDMFKATSYFVIPEYFPAFQRFAVDNDKMYFLTYNEKPGKRELVVADFKGKILKKVYVPYFNEEMHTYFAIENDKFYFIKENEDEEQWELHVEDIK